MKKFLHGILRKGFWGLMICLCFMMVGCGKWKPAEEKRPDNNKAETSVGLEVHYIDVGQGDCTLIINQGHAMLIDAGEDDKGTTVQKYLKDLGIKKLDYVIGTHPDADHIGGLDVILTKFDCEMILFPDAESDTVSYWRVIEVIERKNYQITRPELFQSYDLGDASFTIIGPVKAYEEGSNNHSIALRVTYGETSFLFLGDADAEAQKDMLLSGAELSCEVLKAGHHGSSDSADLKFLETVSPEYAVISCGMGNDYGHPHARTLNLFKDLGISVFRTDEQGTIKAVSDGKKITWNQMPSVSWKAGVYNEDRQDNVWQNEENKKDLSNYQYILNIRSYKFHKPECESVAEMSRSNCEGSNLTKEEIIALGYIPCNNCKP